MKPEIMARAAAKKSAFRAWARLERPARSSGPSREDRSVVKVAFLSSLVMIALQAVQKIPNERNNSRCRLSKCGVMAGRVLAIHEDMRIDSAARVLRGRQVLFRRSFLAVGRRRTRLRTGAAWMAGTSPAMTLKAQALQSNHRSDRS